MEPTEQPNQQSVDESAIPIAVTTAPPAESATLAEAPVTATPITLPPSITNAQSPVPKPHGKRKRIIALLVLLIVIGAAAATFFLLKSPSKSAVVNTAKTVTTAAKPASTFVDSYLPQPIELKTQPTIFSDYGYFGQDCTNVPNNTAANFDPSTCPNEVTASDMVYKQLGTTKSGQKIIYVSNGQPGQDHQDFIVLQTGATTYSMLAKFQQQFEPSQYNSASGIAQSEQQLRKVLAPGVTLDLDTNLPDLVFPTDFSVKQTNFQLSFTPAQIAGYAMPNGLTDIRGSYEGSTKTNEITKVGTYQNRTIYQVVVQDDPSFTVKEYYLTLDQDYAAAYVLNDGIVSTNTDDTTTPAKFVWSDGTSNKDAYANGTEGCGSATGFLVAKDISASQLASVGTAPNGKQVYELPTSSALFQKLYTEDYGSGTNLQDSSLQNLTAAQIQARHVIVVVQNGVGDYVVYHDTNYFAGGGCAKPVIYLYPTHSELVNVAVGANITKSDPVYGQHGWVNVAAQSNGQLTYQGQSYNSLYWEGTGLGNYPFIANGTVVKRADAVSTIRTQLAEQGLKQSEINDFVTYWAPRLPDSKYIRLSWLNTAQMNQLAPLTISPKPQTVIRVFLDFQGLNQPITIPAQHFSAPQRTGFTVVEWGGLNRDQN